MEPHSEGTWSLLGSPATRADRSTQPSALCAPLQLTTGLLQPTEVVSSPQPPTQVTGFIFELHACSCCLLAFKFRIYCFISRFELHRELRLLRQRPTLADARSALRAVAIPPLPPGSASSHLRLALAPCRSSSASPLPSSCADILCKVAEADRQLRSLSCIARASESPLSEIRACAIDDLKTCTLSVSGGLRSSVKRPAPVTNALSSLRRTGAPIPNFIGAVWFIGFLPQFSEIASNA